MHSRVIFLYPSLFLSFFQLCPHPQTPQLHIIFLMLLFIQVILMLVDEKY